MTEDELRFWDDIFRLSVPRMEQRDHLVNPSWSKALAEHAAIVADRAVELRRERQESSTSA